ncbi:MAG: replicative DNA helicase, partial [Firmicutes bacterium]|nr:replicative DNA helicase [Bacillota bacterium]
MTRDDLGGLDRLPPQNLEAEQSALGSMLLDKEAIAKVVEILVAEDFYREAHRIIFDTVVTLFNRGEPADLITVTEVLRQRNALEQVGGASYISTLANTVPTSANAEHYAKIVRNKSILRSLVAAGTQIVSIGYEGSSEVEESLDQAEQLIFRIAQRGETGTVTDMKTVLMSTFDRIERLYTSKGAVTGLPTGFSEMDNMLSGLQPSELIVVAARPSMGKTAFALNIAEHVGVHEEKPVLIFSLEMSAEQLAQRMLCAQAAVDGQRLRRGNLTQQDWDRLSKAIGRLSEAPIFIDDTPTVSALEIRARSRRLKAEHGLALIVVDYLQLIQSRSRAESRQQEIAEITRSLKALAREL